MGKLKNAWDLEFRKNSQLVLILCGSVSSWIEENILKNTGFLGRISLNLTLEELPLSDCNQFWAKAGSGISPYEKFKVLSVTGGVPRYLEEIHVHLPAETNIKNLCFDQSGFLFDEFEKIFTDIFSNKSETYKRLIESIKDGKYEYEDIYRNLGIEKSGFITEYLENLEKSGFIKRDYTWHLKEGKVSKLSKYRISDNYLRFYLNCILPNKEKIIKNSFSERSLTAIPGWSGIMGMQFENLVLNNRQLIQKQLKLNPNDIVFDNPYFQNKTTRQKSCQIDYLIQTQFDTLFVCEIKFSKHPIPAAIIPEVQEKLKRLKVPRHMSRRPVLLHVNGVKEEVLEASYFSEVIDFGKLLEDS